jgi:hypothetical protein
MISFPKIKKKIVKFVKSDSGNVDVNKITKLGFLALLASLASKSVIGGCPKDIGGWGETVSCEFKYDCQPKSGYTMVSLGEVGTSERGAKISMKMENADKSACNDKVRNPNCAPLGGDYKNCDSSNFSPVEWDSNGGIGHNYGTCDSNGECSRLGEVHFEDMVFHDNSISLQKDGGKIIGHHDHDIESPASIKGRCNFFFLGYGHESSGGGNEANVFCGSSDSDRVEKVSDSNCNERTTKSFMEKTFKDCYRCHNACA